MLTNGTEPGAPELGKIGELRQKAAESETVTRDFMDPKQPKRGRGRPPNDPNAPKKERDYAAEHAKRKAKGGTGTDQAGGAAAADFDFKKGARGIFTVASALIVRSTGVQALALMSEEIDALGDAWGTVAEIYIPETLSKHGALIMAGTITAGVAMRLHTTLDAEVKRAQAAYAAAHPDEPRQPGGDVVVLDKERL